MITVEDTIRQLSVNAAAVKSLVGSVTDEQAGWKPTPDTWSLKDTLVHLYNEERIDFRLHLREMFSEPPVAWGTGEPLPYLQTDNLAEAINGFLKERLASLEWLRSLKTPNWNIKSRVRFHPDEEEIVLRAGDVLASWIEHDFLHLRQLIELLYAWNIQKASPYLVDYAGGW